MRRSCVSTVCEAERAGDVHPGRLCLLRGVLVYQHELMLQEAYACVHDSPESKREHLLQLRKRAYFTIDLNGKTCHLVRDPPSTCVVQLSIGWHARSMVMKLSGVSLIHLSCACP